MAIAAIVINQQGKPPGVAGCSRNDLAIGTMVVLTNHDNTDIKSWTWKLLSAPAGSKVSLRGVRNPTATFVPDLTGSYEIHLTVSGSSDTISDRRIAAIGTSFLGLKKPISKNVFDPIDDQWLVVNEAFDLIDADAARNLKRDGSNSPSSDVSWDGRKITSLGGLELDGVLRFGKAKDPEVVDGKAFLYLKEIGGGLDLFFGAPDGSLIRLTRDGRLNVPVSFDDRIKLHSNDSAPGYLGAKVIAANGLMAKEIDGALWIGPVYGSKPGTVCIGDDPRLSDARAPLPHDHGVDEIGTATPAVNAIPRADQSGRLDNWVSEATSTSKGTVRLGRDLAGSAQDPKVVGLRGAPLPEGARDSFLKWSADGTYIEAVPYGTGDCTICQGNDPRLSDFRVPTGKAGGQLAGLFPNPEVVGITDVDKNSLKIGKIPNKSVLVCRDGQITGVDPSGRRTVTMVTNERTSSKEGELVGCFILDGSESTTPLTFLAISRVIRSGLVGFVRLYNATDNILVVELKVGETTLANKRANIRLLPGKKLYEVYIRLDNGQQVDDVLVCMWAGFLTDQYM
jgi:hypothetical protein